MTSQLSAGDLLDALQVAVSSAATLEVADRLCEAAAERTSSRGASLSALFAPDMSVPIGVSGAEAALAEQIQFSTGEGPCWQAFTSQRPVRVANIAAAYDVDLPADLSTGWTREWTRDLTANPDEVGRKGGSGGGRGDGLRWPGYAEQLLRRTTFRAVLTVPVRLESGLPVALSVFSDEVDPAGHRVDTGELAAGLARVLDSVSPPPDLGGAAWLDSSSSLRRAVVWMAEAQLMGAGAGLGHVEALELLRARAAVEGVLVDEVAGAVVSGRLPVQELLQGL